MKVYIDTCSLNRIFDDQSQPRIYMESSSMLIIFKLIDAKAIEFVSSDVLSFENSGNPYEERMEFVKLCLQNASRVQSLDENILKRAEEIEQLQIHISRDQFTCTGHEHHGQSGREQQSVVLPNVSEPAASVVQRNQGHKEHEQGKEQPEEMSVSVYSVQATVECPYGILRALQDRNEHKTHGRHRPQYVLFLLGQEEIGPKHHENHGR